ncbi:MAG: ABC transporter ATP-binding protein [Candidatus Brocadiia bacterium]
MGARNGIGSSPILHVTNLTKEYGVGEAKVRALRGVSFDVREGEFIVVLGPSGSGKSTLLHVLGGMELPTTGSFLFDDREISSYDAAMLTQYRRREVGFVFQFYNLVPNLTAFENVQLAADLSKSHLDVVELMLEVGLGERMQHFPAQMSGGEQQRVAIARALAKNPRLVLCDEPTGALDYETGKLILALLERVNGGMGKTLVVITHNASIGQMADRVIKLRSGEITELIVNKHRALSSEIEW